MLVLQLCTHILRSAAITSKVLVSTSLLSGGVGNGRGTGGVAERGDWREKEIIIIPSYV